MQTRTERFHRPRLCLALLLELFLHIRLCCCLISDRINASFLREQQLSLYILYIFICLTVTSLPFYFHRASEILFDAHLSSYHHPWINSCTFAQLLLCGISVQPVLYALLVLRPRVLFRLKCYTSIQMPTDVQLESHLLLPYPVRYSLHVSSFYPRLQLKLRTLSQPTLADEVQTTDLTRV